MIREYEVALLLSTELPGMHNALVQINGTENVFKSIQCFTDYTIGLVKSNKLGLVKDCFALAEKMFREGCGVVRIAVENVYVFSIGIAIDNLKDSKSICELMTPGMKTVHSRHIHASGI